MPTFSRPRPVTYGRRPGGLCLLCLCLCAGCAEAEGETKMAGEQTGQQVSVFTAQPTDTKHTQQTQPNNSLTHAYMPTRSHPSHHTCADQHHCEHLLVFPLPPHKMPTPNPTPTPPINPTNQQGTTPHTCFEFKTPTCADQHHVHSECLLVSPL